MTVALLVSAVLLVIGLALDITATVTNEWMTYSNTRQERIHEGIWSICLSGTCETIPDTEVFNAVRAVMLLGVALSGVAVILAIIEYTYSSCTERYTVVNVLAVLGLVIAADLCTVIAVIVQQLKIKDNRSGQFADVDNGYSFWLAIASIGLFTIVTTLLVVASFLHARQKKIADDKHEDRQRWFPVEREVRERPRPIGRSRSTSYNDNSQPAVRYSFVKRSDIQRRHRRSHGNLADSRDRRRLRRSRSDNTDSFDYPLSKSQGHPRVRPPRDRFELKTSAFENRAFSSHYDHTPGGPRGRAAVYSLPVLPMEYDVSGRPQQQTTSAEPNGGNVEPVYCWTS